MSGERGERGEWPVGVWGWRGESRDVDPGRGDVFRGMDREFTLSYPAWSKARGYRQVCQLLLQCITSMFSIEAILKSSLKEVGMSS